MFLPIPNAEHECDSVSVTKISETYLIVNNSMINIRVRKLRGTSVYIWLTIIFLK